MKVNESSFDKKAKTWKRCTFKRGQPGVVRRNGRWVLPLTCTVHAEVDCETVHAMMSVLDAGLATLFDLDEQGLAESRGYVFLETETKGGKLPVDPQLYDGSISIREAQLRAERTIERRKKNM